MITIQLLGGHGNQLFQWAFGLAQAKRLGTKLQLNTSLLRGDRPFSLNQWNLDLLSVPYQVQATFREQGMPYNPDLANTIKNGDVIQGYWQTEKYITSIEDELFALGPRETDNRTLELVQNPPTSVAVHVRRGDYLKEPHKSFHGNLDWETYYKPAMDYVRSKVEDPKFYIFTDDPKWVRWSWPTEDTVVIDPTTEAADIFSMALCRHAITANSSFSWWGAHLGDIRDGRRRHRTEDRVVVAPKNWFQSTEEDARDIVKTGWVKI